MSHHKAEELKGRMKEAVGDLTGNKQLEREGKLDQASATTKDKVGKVVDSIKNAVDGKSS